MKNTDTQGSLATGQTKKAATRRRFLTAGAATVAGGAAAVSMPNIALAKTVTLKV